ncbi:MAG: hypothetical protein CL927_20535 [Deltaproteobacteria bacterium]|nr:hypothetical protein [Deltaproteobacteria bacterium]HCH64820.1 hypothetical protein [Deltaproteobacteria bacterium]
MIASTLRIVVVSLAQHHLYSLEQILVVIKEGSHTAGFGDRIALQWMTEERRCKRFCDDIT